MFQDDLWFGFTARRAMNGRRSVIPLLDGTTNEAKSRFVPAEMILLPIAA